MKGHQKKPFHFGDLQMKFLPKSLSLSKPTPQPLKIYLQKNVQVIGQIEQLAAPAPNSLRYTFSESLKPIIFRSLSAKQCVYQVSLYEVENGTNQQRWVGDAELDVSKYLKAYEEQFRQNEQKLLVEMKEKESSIADLWRSLQNNFTSRKWAAGARFKTINALLQYQLVPEHEYDLIVKKDDQDLIRMELTAKNKNMTRSNTQPMTLKNFHYKKKQDKKEIKAAFQRFSSEMQIRVNALSHISEQEESVIQASRLNPTANDTDIDKELEDQELKEIKEMVNEENSTKQFLLPQPHNIPEVGRYSSLIRPENQAPSRLGLVSAGSNTDKPINMSEVSQKAISPSHLKQTSLTLLGLVLAVFLVVFLMKPLPKVD